MSVSFRIFILSGILWGCLPCSLSQGYAADETPKIQDVNFDKLVPQPLEILATDSELHKFHKKKFNIARDMLNRSVVRIESGRLSLRESNLLEDAKRLHKTAIEMKDVLKLADLMTYNENYLKTLRYLEGFHEKMVEAGVTPKDSLDQVRFEQMEAEIVRLKLKEASKK